MLAPRVHVYQARVYQPPCLVPTQTVTSDNLSGTFAMGLTSPWVCH